MKFTHIYQSLELSGNAKNCGWSWVRPIIGLLVPRTFHIPSSFSSIAAVNSLDVSSWELSNDTRRFEAFLNANDNEF